jgi:Domain of unknown function (DUF4333)
VGVGRIDGEMRRALVVAVLLSPAIAACGGSVILAKPTAVTVARFVFEHTGFRPRDVSCPSGVPAKVGGRFQCHFTGPDGNYTADMVIKSVKGTRVEYGINSRRTG